MLNRVFPKMNNKIDLEKNYTFHPSLIDNSLYADEEEDTIDLLKLFLTLWQYKYIIFIFSFLGIIASTIIAVNLPPKEFVSEASFSTLNSDSNQLRTGQYSKIANFMGLDLPTGEGAVDYQMIMNSRMFSEDIILGLDLLPAIFEDAYDPINEKFVIKEVSSSPIQKVKKWVLDLIKFGDKEEPKYTIIDYNTKKFILAKGSKELKEKVKISKEGSFYQIQVKWQDPVYAANIANQYIQELQTYLIKKSSNQKKKNQLYIEVQYEKAKQRMSIQEGKLRIFLEKYGLPIENHAAVISTTIGEIKKQIATEEVNLQILNKFQGIESSQVTLAKERLAALMSQLHSIESGNDDLKNKSGFKSYSVSLNAVPSLSIEYQYLIQELKVQQEIYKMLRTQLESIKLEEGKEKESIQIIDLAIPPEFPPQRNKKMIILVGTVSFILFSLIFVLFLDYIRNMIRNQKYQN